MAIYHVYSDYVPKDPATQLRHSVARRTWTKQPWTDKGIKDSQLPRMWPEEGRTFPFLKDVWDLGVAGLDDTDIAVFTNSDICVTSNCCAVIAALLQSRDAVYSYRRDFHFQFTNPIPDADVLKGQPYAGSDLYAFRAKWWRDWGVEFPDLLIGIEGWDPCMRVLMEQSHDGMDVQARDIIYHERHGSFWENPANRYRLRAQRHNLNTECAWLVSVGINPMQFGIRPI